MKSIRNPLIAAGLILGLSALAMAQTSSSNPNQTSTPASASTLAQASAQPMAKMHASMQAKHAQRFATLKSKLQLDAAQESTWLSFTQAMQMPTPPATRPDRAAMEKLTTPERLDLMHAHKAQRDAEMLKRTEATKSFYASLTSDQKKVFDSETARFMKSMGDHMHKAKHAGHHADHH